MFPQITQVALLFLLPKKHTRPDSHADTHRRCISAEAFVSERVSTYWSYFGHGTIQQVADKRKGGGVFAPAWTRVCVSACDLSYCPRVLPLFFLFSELCASVSCVRSFFFFCVCVTQLDERTQKPRTMRRALAEETDFCPTPTNRKRLLASIAPRFRLPCTHAARIHAARERWKAVCANHSKCSRGKKTQ